MQYSTFFRSVQSEKSRAPQEFCTGRLTRPNENGRLHSMKESVIAPVRQKLFAGVRARGGVEVPPAAFHLPARSAPASAFLPEEARVPYRWADAGSAFGAVLGAPLVLRTELDGSYLLLHFTGAFYDALVAHIRASLPAAADDRGRLALNRMLALARKAGEGCPDDPAAKRLLWQLVCLYERPGGIADAERAATAYLTQLPPRERQRLAGQSGALADAAARILFQFRKDGFPCN